MPFVLKNAVIIYALLALLLITGCESSSRQNAGEHAGATMNYHRINQHLATGGHFVDDGLATVKAEGVTVVIDLRDQPPAGQQELLAAQGIEWINVPIVWDDPQAIDFTRFSEAMQAHQGDHILVQCAANYRASAMTYLYRILIEQVDEATAAKDLYAVWTPADEYPHWSDYIERVKASQP